MEVQKLVKENTTKDNSYEIIKRLDALEKEVRTLRYEILQTGIIPHHVPSPIKNAQQGIQSIIENDLEQVKHQQHINQESILNFAFPSKEIQRQKENSKPFFKSLDAIDIIKVFNHPTLPKKTKLDNYLLGLGKNLITRRQERKINTKKHQKKAHPEKAFWFSEGTAIHSLKELETFIKNSPEHIYYEHVTHDRNDFASWIKEVLHLKHLARTVSLAKSREEFLAIISQANKK
ncbi:MAG: hypothetical protein ACMXYE_03780 [Candidatus Woesearchaeota archaeon]